MKESCYQWVAIKSHMHDVTFISRALLSPLIVWSKSANKILLLSLTEENSRLLQEVGSSLRFLLAGVVFYSRAIDGIFPTSVGPRSMKPSPFPRMSTLSPVCIHIVSIPRFLDCS